MLTKPLPKGANQIKWSLVHVQPPYTCFVVKKQGVAIAGQREKTAETKPGAAEWWFCGLRL